MIEEVKTTINSMEPATTMVMGSFITLAVGAVWAAAGRAVTRGASIKRSLDKIQSQVSWLVESHSEMRSSMKNMDTKMGSVITALKITVKKVRYDMGRFEPGEEFNGDLKEAWDEIRRADQVHREEREIAGGVGHEQKD